MVATCRIRCMVAKQIRSVEEFSAVLASFRSLLMLLFVQGLIFTTLSIEL